MFQRFITEVVGITKSRNGKSLAFQVCAAEAQIRPPGSNTKSAT